MRVGQVGEHGVLEARLTGSGAADDEAVRGDRGLPMLDLPVLVDADRDLERLVRRVGEGRCGLHLMQNHVGHRGPDLEGDLVGFQIPAGAPPSGEHRRHDLLDAQSARDHRHLGPRVVLDLDLGDRAVRGRRHGDIRSLVDDLLDDLDRTLLFTRHRIRDRRDLHDENAATRVVLADAVLLTQAPGEAREDLVQETGVGVVDVRGVPDLDALRHSHPAAGPLDRLDERPRRLSCAEVRQHRLDGGVHPAGALEGADARSQRAGSQHDRNHPDQRDEGGEGADHIEPGDRSRDRQRE